MLKSLYFLLVTLILVTSCGEKRPSEEEKFQNTTFDVHGKSDFTFVNFTSDTIEFFLTNWLRLPSDFIEYEQKIAPNDSLKIQLQTQGFSYVDFDFSDSALKFLTSPNAVNSFYKLTDTSYFIGDFDTINNYWKQTGGNHYRNHETSMNLVNLTQREHYTYLVLMSKNDKIIKEATQNLITAKNELPNWYIQLESDRLKIQGAHFKFSSLIYRKRVLNYTDEIPEGYVRQIMNGVPIENEKLMGFNQFPHLLRWYSQNTIWPINDPVKSHTPNIFDSLMLFMDTVFTPAISDYAISTYLSTSLQLNPEFSADKWIELIDNQKLTNTVIKQASQKEVLPEGSVSPIISGIQTDSSAFISSQVNDSLILFNFWASYCKPCIKKFEHENTLVEYFKNKPVKIVNVCIESNWERFISLVDIHQLKTINIFIDDSKLKETREAFGIHGLPHSVLVDKEGLIIKNKYHVQQDSTENYIESLL